MSMQIDYNYFSNPEIPEEEKRDHAFQTVNAVRESLTLAKNLQPLLLTSSHLALSMT